MSKEADKMKFAKFLALPKEERKDEFGYWQQYKFADKYGYSKDTMTNWKQDEEIKKQVKRYWEEWGFYKTPLVVRSLYKSILQEGRSSEIKLWLEYFLDWARTEKREHGVSGGLADLIKNAEEILDEGDTSKKSTKSD